MSNDDDYDATVTKVQAQFRAAQISHLAPSHHPAWFGPLLLRAQRIDAYENFAREHPDYVAECPIGESVLRDLAYANPPFERVNDYAADLQ